MSIKNARAKTDCFALAFIYAETKNTTVVTPLYCLYLFTIRSLSVLTLTSRFGLLLALYAGLFVMFSLTNFSRYAASEIRSLKSAESAIDGFVLLNSYLCHFKPSLTSVSEEIASIGDIISNNSTHVNKRINNF